MENHRNICPVSDENVIEYAKIHGNRNALLKFPLFLRNDKHRHRSRILTALVSESTNKVLPNQISITKCFDMFGLKKTLKIHKQFCEGDKNRGRKLAAFLNEHKRNMVSKLPRLNKVSEKIWTKLLQAPVELSKNELQCRMADLSPILRRRANDPLPCSLLRPNTFKRTRYEYEDEENCWEQILGCEAASKLTLEDRLLLPASIRSKFQLLFHSQSNLMWFPNYRSLPRLTRVIFLVNFK
jgi:hypothetical protein